MTNPIKVTPGQARRLQRNLEGQGRKAKEAVVRKKFMLYFENDDVDGFQIMKALRKIKGYHHVQDVTQLNLEVATEPRCTCRHPTETTGTQNLCGCCGKRR